MTAIVDWQMVYTMFCNFILRNLFWHWERGYTLFFQLLLFPHDWLVEHCILGTHLVVELLTAGLIETWMAYRMAFMNSRTYR